MLDFRLNWNRLRPELIVADVIPNPLRTNLVQDAESRGCTVIDGLGMLVNQGVISIKYWTGEDVEPSVHAKSRNRSFRPLEEMDRRMSGDAKSRFGIDGIEENNGND